MIGIVNLVLDTLAFQFYKLFLFEIILSEDWIILLAILILILSWAFISESNNVKKRLKEYIEKVKEQELLFQKKEEEHLNKIKEQVLTFDKREADLKVFYQNWALTELEKFKNLEISNIQKKYEENAINAAANLLEKWKLENEFDIRQDAINRSYSVNLGKITEHLVPFHIKFPFNPKDARFIGSPIDLIVFDGHSDHKDEIIIYIVEVKTGNSKLTESQKRIKEAVMNKNICWYEINPDNHQTDFFENAL